MSLPSLDLANVGDDAEMNGELEDYLEQGLVEEIEDGADPPPAESTQTPPTVTPSAVVSIPDLYVLGREECGTTSITENRAKGIWKLWAEYCRLKSVAPFAVTGKGFDLFPQEAIDSNSPESYNRTHINAFFSWMGERRDYTSNKLKQAKTFFNSHLKAEFYAKMKTHNPNLARIPDDINVGKDEGAKALTKKMQRLTSQIEREQMVDLQADLDTRIENHQFRTMMKQVFRPKPGGKVECQRDPLSSLIFASGINAQMADLRRAEQHVAVPITCFFTRRIRGLGPEARGTKSLMFVSNKSKVNKTGAKDYMAMGPHADPLRDTSSWLGLLFLYRIVVQNWMPNFLDYKEMMGTSVFPALPRAARTNPSKTHIDETTYRDIWKNAFADANVLITKVTSQTRKQGLQEMDEDGVAPGVMSRMTGHRTASTPEQSNAQLVHYLTNVPPSGVVSRLFGDPKNPKDHFPEWFHLSDGNEIQQLLHMLTPRILAQGDPLLEQFNSCTSHEERKERRLFALVGCYHAVVFCMRNAIKMLATRLRCHDTGKLLYSDNPTLWDEFYSGQLSDLLNHQAFRSGPFNSLKARMRIAENQSNEIPFAPGQRTEMQRAIHQVLVPALSQISRQQQLLASRIDKIASNGEQKTTETSGQDESSPASDARKPTAAIEVKPRPEGRKQRPRILQRSINSSETVRGVGSGPEPIPRPKLDDSSCRTARDHYQLYKTKWKPLEDKYGSEWRVDLPFLGTDGRHEKRNQKKTWWSKKSPIYFVVDELVSRKAMPEEEAIEEALADVQRRCFDPVQPYNIQKIAANCKQYLEEITGRKRQKGRPKGSRTAMKSHRPQRKRVKPNSAREGATTGTQARGSTSTGTQPASTGTQPDPFLVWWSNAFSVAETCCP